MENISEFLSYVNMLSNTVKMYDNTLKEMAEANSSKFAIAAIMKEKESTEKKLRHLLDNFKSEEEAKEETVAQFNHYRQDENFFDSIKKQDVYPTPPNSIEAPNEEKEKIPYMQDSVEMTSKNRFIVDFGDRLPILPHMVEVVNCAYFDYSVKGMVGGTLQVVVKDYVSCFKNSDNVFSLAKCAFDMKRIEEFANIGDITVSMLDATGARLYNVVYKNCSLQSLSCDTLDYNSQDYMHYILFFSFQDVEISTSSI